MNTILISKTNCKTSTKSSIRYLAFATGASLILLAGATSSCGTARGFGQDVEKTGDKIQDAATH
jgi:predicted small secreted protein